MSGIGFKTGGYHSSTGWEKSHFGGHQRLIWDYPYVNVPDSVKLTPSKNVGDLQHYSAGKLLKILFMAAKDQGIAEELFDPKSAEIVQVKSGYAWNAKEEPKIKLTATTESVKRAIPIICSAEPELAPLFDEYKTFLIDSEYEILLDIPEDMGKGEGTGEGKGESKGEKGKGEGKEGEGKKGEGKGGEGKGSGKGEDGKGSGKGKESEDGKGGGAKGKHKNSADLERGGKGAGHSVGTGPEEGTIQDAISKIDDMSPEERTKLVKELINKIGERVIREMIKEIVESIKKGHGYVSTGVTGMSTTCEVVPNFKVVKPASVPSKMYQHEIQNAEMLLKMLDISWESKSDTIKSLRMGKLDASKIAEIPAGNMSVYQREMEDVDTKPFSICILVDESGSMGHTKPNEMSDEDYDYETGKYVRRMSRGTSAYHLCKSLYHAFSQLIPQDKMYIYGHTTGGPSGAQVFSYHDPYAQNFMKSIDDMIVRRKGSNYDGPVVDAVHKKVRSFTDDRIIFLVLSDGQPAAPGYGGRDDIDDFKRIVERAKRDEFVTAGIFMQYAGAKEMYSYSTKIDDMNDMPKKVSHLLNKIVKTEFQ